MENGPLTGDLVWVAVGDTMSASNATGAVDHQKEGMVVVVCLLVGLLLVPLSVLICCSCRWSSKSTSRDPGVLTTPLNLQQQVNDWAGHQQREERAKESKWTRIWEAQHNLRPRGPACVPQVLRLTWHLSIVVWLFSFTLYVDGDATMPYKYSRVSCCGANGTPKNLPSHYDLKLKNGTVIGACDIPAVARSDPTWSHSMHCANYAYVQQFIQELQAIRTPIVQIANAACLPLGAAAADAFGRKTIMIFSISLSCIGILCNLIDALPWFIANDVPGYLLYASSIFSALGSAATTVFAAAVVDLLPHDMRSSGFGTYQAFTAAGPLTAFIVAFYLLSLDIDDYSWFWVFALVVQVTLLAFAVVFMPETLPRDKRKQFVLAEANPVSYYTDCLKLLLQDPVKIGLSVNSFLCCGLAVAGFNALIFSYLIGPLHYTQQLAMLPGVVSQFSSFFWAAVSVSDHARNRYVGKSKSCMVYNAGLAQPKARCLAGVWLGDVRHHDWLGCLGGALLLSR